MVFLFGFFGLNLNFCVNIMWIFPHSMPALTSTTSLVYAYMFALFVYYFTQNYFWSGGYLCGFIINLNLLTWLSDKFCEFFLVYGVWYVCFCFFLFLLCKWYVRWYLIIISMIKRLPIESQIFETLIPSYPWWFRKIWSV